MLVPGHGRLSRVCAIARRLSRAARGRRAYLRVERLDAPRQDGGGRRPLGARRLDQLKIASWIGNWELDVAIEDDDSAPQMKQMFERDLRTHRDRVAAEEAPPDRSAAQRRAQGVDARGVAAPAARPLPAPSVWAARSAPRSRSAAKWARPKPRTCSAARYNPRPRLRRLQVARGHSYPARRALRPGSRSPGLFQAWSVVTGARPRPREGGG